jgi:hypothetical protein
MVFHSGAILCSAAADEDDGVLLDVVAYAKRNRQREARFIRGFFSSSRQKFVPYAAKSTHFKVNNPNPALLHHISPTITSPLL